MRCNTQTFKRLKGAFFANDISYSYLAQKIGKSMKYVSYRMQAEYPWSIEDVYAICDLLEIPYDQIPDYFPKGEKEESAKRRAKQ